MSTYSSYLLLLHCNEVLKGFTENVGGHSGPLTPQLWWPGQHFKWPRATGPPLRDPLLSRILGLVQLINGIKNYQGVHDMGRKGIRMFILLDKENRKIAQNH